MSWEVELQGWQNLGGEVFEGGIFPDRQSAMNYVHVLMEDTDDWLTGHITLFDDKGQIDGEWTLEG